MGQRSQIRERLRAATADAHERLHRHAGFAAAADGSIELPAYRRLLGFHRAFEDAIGAATRIAPGVDLDKRRRSPMLEADLAALGANSAEIARLPLCERVAAPASAGELLGALYVIEGSTLGGVHIARALAPVCASLDGGGRAFFLGYGERHGAMWRAFLDQLDAAATSDAQEARIIEGATSTFLAFELWMDDWNVDGPMARYASAAAAINEDWRAAHRDENWRKRAEWL